MINNASREYVVSEIEKGGEYDFVVTATNDYGDSPKMGGCKGVKLPEGRYNVTKICLLHGNTINTAIPLKKLFVSNWLYFSFSFFNQILLTRFGRCGYLFYCLTIVFGRKIIIKKNN